MTVATSASRVNLSLFALALGGFAIGTTEFATMGVLPDIADDLHTSIPSAGHLISLYALGVVVGAPLFAVLGARMRRKNLLVVLMAIFALGNFASVLAPNFAVLALARFASGLPHGAFFGIGSVVAATLLPHARAHAFAMMMLGLTVANVVGVPLATVLGQQFGWRSTYALVTVVAALTMAAVFFWIPLDDVHDDAGIRRELGALGRLQVWMALLIGAIGFGGFFAVYSYIAPTMTKVAGLHSSQIWFVLMTFGIGMTIGNVIGGRLADRAVVPTIYAGLGGVLVVLVTFTVAAHHAIPAIACVFGLGMMGSVAIPALQTRLMDVSADAQSLAAALNHSALNIANSLGAWLGGLVIAAGYGYASTGWVGAGLAAGGIAIVSVSVVAGRRRV
jgi:DHA1 family inner membrane transport protein